jgi:hypothetical protein
MFSKTQTEDSGKAQAAEFDYAALDAGARRLLRDRARHIRGLMQATLGGIVDIGRGLAEVKEKLPHGQFLKWIRAEFGWKRTTAWRFMEVFEKIKCSNLEHLQIDVSALYEITAPSTPEPVRKEIIRRGEAGEKITHKAARTAIASYRAASEPTAPVALALVPRKREEVETVSQAIEVLAAMDLGETATEIASLPPAVRTRFLRKADGAREKLSVLVRSNSSILERERSIT